MKRYFIEVPHGATRRDCLQAIQVFRQTGSHFLTRADWGCLDGEHKAWIIAEVDSKEDARNIVPPFYRTTAKIVELASFADSPELGHDD